MAKLKAILSFANDLLKSDQFTDYCPNGLQVEGKSDVTHITTGVSASVELFQRAKDIQADLVLVHHGIIWGSNPQTITGNFKKRIEALLCQNISLLAYHLPLDAHEELGNNALIADLFKLKNRESFAKYKGRDIGVIGYLDESTSVNDFEERIKITFQCNPISYHYGSDKVQKVAVVSGGAPECIIEAAERTCDVYITGEVAESTLHLAKEERMNFIAAGHYNTEKYGVQALGNRIAKEFNIKHTFIDIPNSI